MYELFNKINLHKRSSLLDLGSGDGRVVLLASLFTKAAGYEANKYLVNIGKRVRKKFDLSASLRREDFMKADFSNYDVLFIYPDKDYNERLLRKIKGEFKGILIVYKIYPFKLKHNKVAINNIPIFVYNMYED